MVVNPAKTRLRMTVAVLRLHEELHADLAPELRDQRQPIDDEGAFAIGLDDDFQFAAVGQQADARGIALGQSDLVEQARGLAGIVAGIRRAQHRVAKAGSPP